MYIFLLFFILIIFLFNFQSDQESIGEQINKFWEEFDDFHNKKGAFENREHIWNSADINNGLPHMWHYRNSFRYTKVLGAIVCRVCSKILGIGSAERSWGDVKHIKTNKRSHLSAERTKKQSTIFGSYCMEKADRMKKAKMDDESKGPITMWSDDDFDRRFDIFAIDEVGNQSKQPERIFGRRMGD